MTLKGPLNIMKWDSSLGASTNVRYYINRMNNKNHMIISIDAEKNPFFPAKNTQ